MLLYCHYRSREDKFINCLHIYEQQSCKSLPQHVYNQWEEMWTAEVIFSKINAILKEKGIPWWYCMGLSVENAGQRLLECAGSSCVRAY